MRKIIYITILSIINCNEVSSGIKNINKKKSIHIKKNIPLKNSYKCFNPKRIVFLKKILFGIILFYFLYTLNNIYSFNEYLNTKDYNDFNFFDLEYSNLFTNYNNKSDFSFKNQYFHNISICNFNLSHILFGTHHKTGTILFTKHFRNEIYSFYRENCKIVDQKISTENCLTKERIDFFLIEKLSKGKSAIITNIIRNPIDTILSGYNYHKISNEKWLQKDLKGMMNYYQMVMINQKKKNKPYSFRAIKLVCSPKILLSLINKANFSNQIIIPEYINEYPFKYKNIKFSNYTFLKIITMQNLYNMLNLTEGLNLEYMRYLFCEFDLDIYKSYIKIKELKILYENNNIYRFENFRLENFFYDFNKTTKKLLNIIGFNKNDQAQIFKKMTVHEINNVQKRKRKNKHLTKDTFDKNEQKRILLQQKSRCKQLKKMTFMLDYKWDYQQYC